MKTFLMKPEHKIFVAGHGGLVGSAIVEVLQSKSYKNILTASRKDLDLTDSNAVDNFLCREQPDVIFLAAAKVGGIVANDTYRADFIHQNLKIQDNVIWGAHQAQTKRLIFLGSSCIYPALASQPMPESCILTGPLETTNRPYALAKIAGLELVQSLRQQYKRDYFSVMPTNLYGPRDNFDLETSHVLPALIRKISEAKNKRSPTVMVWGSGNPKREFMLSTECAKAIIFLAETLTAEALAATSIGQSGWSHINIGTGEEISIKELAEMIAHLTGYEGELIFDRSRPDGTPRKLLDASLLHGLGWRSSIPLMTGVKQLITWYQEKSSLCQREM